MISVHRLACLVLSCVVASTSAQDIIGATLEVCLSCRVKDLPEVSYFASEVLPLYPAVTLEDVVGSEPVLHYLDAYGAPVSSVLVAGMSSDAIIEHLAEHGIFMWTPRAEYLPLPIEAMQNCIAWRQTNGCSGESGSREPRLDEKCDVRITFDRSGYCECLNGRRVVLDCDHDEGSCLQYCSV
jgi:hypothetical protein